MASWLMRMVSSSGKSTGRGRGTCSGRHALAHCRSFRGPCRRPFQDTAGPGTAAPLGATITPASRSSTEVRKAAFSASFASLGGRAARSACHCAVVARYSRPPLRVAALRRNSREIVEAARPSRRATSCMEQLCARRSAISSRSANERYRPESGFADGLDIDGGIPPACLNHRVPTACDTPASTAASSLARPAAIAAQNRRRSSRPAIGGRPGENNGGRPDRSERRFRADIATSSRRVLRRPLESAQLTSVAFTTLLRDNAIAISRDGKGAWRDNVFVERIWRSVKYEEVDLRAYDSVAEAKASIGRYLAFYNSKRPHSSLDARTPDRAYLDHLPQVAAAA